MKKKKRLETKTVQEGSVYNLNMYSQTVSLWVGEGRGTLYNHTEGMCVCVCFSV